MTPVLEDVVRFLGAVAAFAVVGVGIGMLVARRLDRWAAAAAEHDDPPDLPETTKEPEEPGDDARPDA